MYIELIYLIIGVPAVALLVLLLFCTQHVVRNFPCESWRENAKRCLALTCFGWFCVAFSTISLSFTLDMILHGSAINGERRGNVFYVGDHGRLSEVSEIQYQWSMTLHRATELVLFPVRTIASIPLVLPFLIGFVWYLWDWLSSGDTESQHKPDPSDAPQDRASRFDNGKSTSNSG